MYSTRDRILEQLQFLPEPLLEDVLRFVQLLVSRFRQPAGTSGKRLLRFAGWMPEEALDEMSRAIEEGCGRVDLDEW